MVIIVIIVIIIIIIIIIILPFWKNKGLWTLTQRQVKYINHRCEKTSNHS